MKIRFKKHNDDKVSVMNTLILRNGRYYRIEYILPLRRVKLKLMSKEFVKKQKIFDYTGVDALYLNLALKSLLEKYLIKRRYIR